MPMFFHGVITKYDLINHNEPAEPSNFRFESCQYDVADVVVYVNGGKCVMLKGAE
jgi:hypothetical protein